MRCFIVTQWNGLDYEEYEDVNVGVFATLDEALAFCKNTVAQSDEYPSREIPADKAYSIEEWVDTKCVTLFNSDGGVEFRSLAVP